MDATMILIDSDAELARARALVDRLWDSNDPVDIARLEAQARLIAAYEELKAPPTTEHRGSDPPPDGPIRPHAGDMVPILGTPSRVSEVLRGKKGLSMAMMQRLRARFRVPADLLLPRPRKRKPGVGPKEWRPDVSWRGRNLDGAAAHARTVSGSGKTRDAPTGAR